MNACGFPTIGMSSSSKPAAGGAAAKPTSAAETLKAAANDKYKAGDYEGAVAAYGAAIEAAPTSVLYTNRAAANFMLKRFSDAVADCEKAVELDPMNVKAYIRSGKSHLGLGNIAKAITVLERGMLMDPRDEAVRGERASAVATQRKLELAKSALAGKQYERALALFDAVADTCPGSYEVHMGRVDALVGLKRFDDAYAVTTELLSGRKSVADTGASAAAEEAEKDKRKGAAAGAGAGSAGAGGSKAVISAHLASRGAADPKLLIKRAQVLNLQGNSASAMKHLTEALRADPDDTTAAKLLRALRKQESLKAAGNEHFKAGRWKDAADAYTECIALDASADATAALGENPGFTSKLYGNRAAALMK